MGLPNNALNHARIPAATNKPKVSNQNFGAVDVFCTDKTGTLTEGKIVLEKHLDVHSNESERVLQN
jgi:P-type E1-E2 ATPase